MTVSLDQQIAEVAREIALRERVYVKWVKSGRLKSATAEKQMAAMRAVLETLKTLAAENTLSLFSRDDADPNS